MKQKLITVFGGSGFVGRHVVRALAREGHRVRVAVRRPHIAGDLLSMGEVGQVQVVQCNLRYEASIREAMRGADGAVNLVGLLYQSGKQKFASVHVDGAKAIAHAAADEKVAHLVHVSAIGADEKSASKYAASKGQAEQEVRAQFPDATILRPSIIFGQEDQFFNKFAAMIRMMPIVPLIAGKTRFQPIFVGDVARSIMACLSSDSHKGKTFEIGGQRVMTMAEVYDLILEITQRPRLVVPWPIAIARVNAFFFGLLPKPVITLDQLRLLEHDNVVGLSDEGVGTIEDLGVGPLVAVEIEVPTYLYRFRKYGQFESPSAA
jgi:NADH dehydrogenase